MYPGFDGKLVSRIEQFGWLTAEPLMFKPSTRSSFSVSRAIFFQPVPFLFQVPLAMGISDDRAKQAIQVFD